MPWLACNSRRIHYELAGPDDGPAFVLINGLTQYVKLWMPFRDALVARGFRVASYDMLGQGQSDKPCLFIEQDDQVAVLRDLITELGPAAGFRRRDQLRRSDRAALCHRAQHTIAGLVPMCSFAELPPQLFRFGTALRTALILGGTTFLQDLLFPMNFSSAWLEAKADLIGFARYRGWLVNDVYALQNLMEFFLNFEPLTPKLSRIRIPTMILTGEYDFLTPRPLQDSLRTHIPESELVIIPRAYHAFTLEKRGIDGVFDGALRRGRDGRPLAGQETIWLAPEEVGGELMPFPAGFDHLRAVPVRLKEPEMTRRGDIRSARIHEAQSRRPLHERASWPDRQGRSHPAVAADPDLGFSVVCARRAGAPTLVAVPGRLRHPWQLELHAQFCREMEILSLLTRATSWVPDPQR